MIAAPAGAASFDPAPWLADLAQMRAAFHEKYANLDWLEREREVNIDRIFDRMAERIRHADSDAAVRATFDRFVQQVHDGHVGLRWPSKPSSSSASPKPPLCARLGYDSRQSSPGIAVSLPGYHALEAKGSNVFPAGLIGVDGRRVGVLRVGVFQPQGYPALCEAARHALSTPDGDACDDACADAILTWSYRRMTADFEARLRQLRAAGAAALLVDISDNGGGSEWAEAAARMVSNKPLTSARMGFVRGPHWAKQWADLASRLRSFARDATRADAARLSAWVAEADVAKRLAESPCRGAAGCDTIGRAGFATGLVGSASAGAFRGKDWAPLVFSIAQFDYHDGVWSGPLLVLVDQETWSAAEEFAAVLQDDRAAIILGARTGGAGCGHTYGGTPTVLANSKAVLELPDCVRFRRDGSNEVRGVIPDEVVGFRAEDGKTLKAELISAALPDAVRRAVALDRN